MTARTGRPPHPDLLTPAEWGVAEMVRHGLTNRQIAERRGVSPDAVKYHVGNIFQKLGFSGRAELRAWSGIRRDSALQGREEAMGGKTGIGGLGQVARTVKDIGGATAWYRDVVGLPFLYAFGNLAFFDCGGVRLFLNEADDAVDESILYFRVDDIHGEVARLAQCGVTVTHAPHLIHRHEDGMEEWMAFFQDPEGRPLGIMAQISQ
jgi:DNA-binding CsgD family transcriptional regulator/catechol 2,3-dioxygenase-like lactoylglutathione lyase family enzyme